MHLIRALVALSLGCAAATLHGGCASFSEAPDDDAGAAVVDGAVTGDDDASKSPYVEAVLADSPVAYWRLDEASGPIVRSLVGGETYRAAVLGTPSYGVGGALANDTDTALRFEADAGQAVDVGVNFDFVGAQSFSLEAWLDYRESDPAFRHLFSKDGSGVNGREEYGMYIEGVAPAAYLVFERYVGGQKLSIDAPLGGSSKSPLLLAGTWHHVVGVYDGTQLRLFIDGEPAGTTADQRSQQSKNAHFYVGARSPTDGTFNGALDEVAVYATALTQSQIETHYRVGSKP